MPKYQPRKGKLSALLDVKTASKHSDELSQLINFAERIQGLDELFLTALPELLRPYFKANTLKSGVLTVTCSSAAQATRMRLQQQQVIKNLHQKGLQSVRTIKVKIRPELKAPQPEPTERHLSIDNAALLESEANNVSDQRLQAVLRKLAQRAKP